MRECRNIVPFQGSECGAEERSGKIYLRWERSSSEISAIGTMAEKVLDSSPNKSNARDETTGETGLKIDVAMICCECITRTIAQDVESLKFLGVPLSDFSGAIRAF